MRQICYRGTVSGLVRHALPELRRAAMRGWTIPSDKHRIQQRLFQARLREMGFRLGGPRGAA